MENNNHNSANTEVTTRTFRQGIIDSVILAIKSKGKLEFMKVPETKAKKESYDAHVRLTDAGLTHFGKHAVFSRQIIHPELKQLTISNSLVPINILNRKDYFEEYAVQKLNEFIDRNILMMNVK